MISRAPTDMNHRRLLIELLLAASLVTLATRVSDAKRMEKGQSRRSSGQKQQEEDENAQLKLVSAERMRDINELLASHHEGRADSKLLIEKHSAVPANESAPIVPDGNLSPVILVPGFACSRLVANVQPDRPGVSEACKKQSGYQELWISLLKFLPSNIDCWADQVSLRYDPETSFARDAEGVSVDVAHFGSPESTRYVDTKLPNLTRYYGKIIERYRSLGYQAGENLFSAPFDYRRAPQELVESFFRRLNKLIEFLHSKVERLDSEGQVHGQRVTLVCHSTGCTHMLLFLRSRPAEWRRTRIRKLIAIATPWGGTMFALEGLLVGTNLDVPLVDRKVIRRIALTFPGVAYLLPQSEILGHLPVVETPERTYTVSELGDLFAELGLHRQWEWFERSAGLIKPLEPLDDLLVDCVQGADVPTIETIKFKNQSDFPDGKFKRINGQGDGLVNGRSLLVCQHWADQMPDLVRNKVIRGASHLAILGHEKLLTFLENDAKEAMQ